ncbi:MAG: BCCT family transporter [Marinoscillum sp.]|uniref:BCCT family transporter n=1 Tax=Marinoscillum sp. TaxID=2024838 RepID=UPI0032F73605
MQQLNPIKFWPPLILLTGTVTYSLVDKEGFLAAAQSANTRILQHFSWLFSWSVLLFVILLLIIYLSPFGKTTIGGKGASPLLSKWKWFSITLCTTIATGILFWGTAEPLFHFHQPPASLEINPASAEARDFSMATMLLHWTLSPYAIYTIAALVFSYCFYNLKRPFEVSSMLFPLMGKHASGIIGHLTDIICLYGLVAGMAASLGAGILTISGGLRTFLGIPPSGFLLLVITLTIVVTFVASASSGLMRGIRILSDYNIKAFILLAIFFFCFGPTMPILETGSSAVVAYIQNFLPRSVNWNNVLDQSWFQSWTVFNWANWLAWTPITALFLGRLGKGYTVRQFILVNLVFPSLFGGLWMMIFSGSAIHFDSLSDGALFQTLTDEGPENVIYAIFESLPFTWLISIIFLLITFISYVTAADSNTSAMSNLCTKGITTEHQEAPVFTQIIWGTIVGALAWIMISYSGIEGIKMISVLGGFPALFLVIAVAFGAIKLMITTKP